MECGAGKVVLFATAGSAPQGILRGGVNESQNFRPTCLSKILKKLLFHSTKGFSA